MLATELHSKCSFVLHGLKQVCFKSRAYIFLGATFLEKHKLITFWFQGEMSSGIKVKIAAQRGRFVDFARLQQFA